MAPARAAALPAAGPPVGPALPGPLRCCVPLTSARTGSASRRVETVSAILELGFLHLELRVQQWSEISWRRLDRGELEVS